MEQEETAASVMSATASDTQGEDSSFDVSAKVSLHSLSPDSDIVSDISVQSSAEHRPHDLSPDGKYEL